MKIRDLNIVDKSALHKLGQYADMSVKEYVAWIEEKKAANENVAEFYLKLYEKIIDGQGELSFTIQDEKPEAKDPIYYELEKIPIEEIQHYVDSKDYNRSCGELRRKGIRNLGQLYECTFSGKLLYEKNS